MDYIQQAIMHPAFDLLCLFWLDGGHVIHIVQWFSFIGLNDISFQSFLPPTALISGCHATCVDFCNIMRT